MKIDSNEYNTLLNMSINFIYKGKLNIDCNDLKYPQQKYKNVKNHNLLNGIYMDTPFCKIKMPDLSKKSGVYLWVEEGEIIYIGETNNLHRRFNSGYGQISPRNCYVGGQNTNVKMNRIALDHYMQGKTIDIYVCETPYNKFLEKYLLDNISTKYNVRNNGKNQKKKP